MTALNKALEIAGGGRARGGVVALAERLGIGPSRLSNWILRESVPPEFIRPICRAVEWSVVPHEFDAQLYPNPDDGLPPEIRATRNGGAPARQAEAA